MRERTLYKSKGDLYQLPSGNMWGVTNGETQTQAGGYPGISRQSAPGGYGLGAPMQWNMPGFGSQGGLAGGYGQGLPQPQAGGMGLDNRANRWFGAMHEHQDMMRQQQAGPSYFNRQVGQMPLPGGLGAYTPQGYGGQPAQQPMGLAGSVGPRAQYGSNIAAAQYQGATPGMVAGRPAWLGQQAEQGGGGIADQGAWAAAQGLHFNPQTGAIGGNSQAAGISQAQLNTAGIIGRSPFQTGPSVQQLATNKAAYKGLAAERAAASKQQVLNRVATRERNAMGLGAFGPEGQAAPNHIAELSQMAQHLAPLVAAGGLTQEQAGGLLKAEMQKRGMQVPTAKAGPLLALTPAARGHMNQQQWKDFIAKPPAEQHAYLLSIGIHPDKAREIIKDYQPTNYGLGGLASSILGETWRGIQNTFGGGAPDRTY